MKGGGAETPFPGTPANPNTNQVSSVDFDVGDNRRGDLTRCSP